ATYAELVRAVAPGVNAAEHVLSRLRFYGATVDSAAVATAVLEKSLCNTAANPARPTVGVVLIAGAFPPVLYEGAAAALADMGIATVVTNGGESSVRLILNHLATLAWPVHKLALVGHGANGPLMNLVAMSSSSVRGIVSLDGFEALNRQRHPGLTGDPAWRPGNLRAPILHWRPFAHPDQDTLHFTEAARAELLQITLSDVPGKQWLTAPEAALAPAALQPVIGASGGQTQNIVTSATVQFLANVLTGKPVDAAGIRRILPARFTLTHRPALPAPALRLDGRLDERIWQNARTLPDATTIRVRVVDDCDWIYAAVVPTRSSPFITELFIRPAGDAASPLTSTDLLLHASASLCWAFGKPDVASNDCNKSEAWWGGSRTSQAGDPPVGEYAISKRALGITRCGSIAGVRVGALVGGWGPNEMFPAGANKNQPSSWALVRQ
ncbi:MAG: hypothetical protein H7Z40_09215, partial [Phycisphaerae bacterium]|nr:hypothetical protein [Gemmatimonadaceae bacterium]